MRLYLLPISTRRALIYCQRLNKQTTEKQSYVDRIIRKAGDTWAKWEASKGGWQKKITEYGNKAMGNIPYEEWGLKSIPPLSARREADEINGKEAVDVVFPGNVMKQQDIPGLLKQLGTERQALHRKRAWWSIAVMPITAPAALIPVIPNLPFFYLVFRSWSHFRALNGSKHVEWLVEKNLLKLATSPTLEKIYSEIAHGKAPAFTVSSTPTPTAERESDEQLILDDGSNKTIANALEMPELVVELERAVKQVRKALQSQKELVEQKKELEKTAADSKPSGGQEPKS